MERLLRHFRRAHHLALGIRTAGRLLRLALGLRNGDPAHRLVVVGSDVSALLPRQVDLPLGELQGAVKRGERATRRFRVA